MLKQNSQKLEIWLMHHLSVRHKRSWKHSDAGSQHMPNTLKSTGYFCIASGGLGHLQMQKLSTFLLIITEHFAECIHLHEFVQVTGFVD